MGHPLVEAVRKHALEHYNEDGWDFCVECHSDEDILEILTSPIYGAPATTVADAIAAVGYVCKLLDERRRDVRSTIW